LVLARLQNDVSLVDDSLSRMGGGDPRDEEKRAHGRRALFQRSLFPVCLDLLSAFFEERLL
jgi:hypothetical protein